MPKQPSPLGLACLSNKILSRLLKGSSSSQYCYLGGGCECSRVGRKLDIQGKNTVLNILPPVFLWSSDKGQNQKSILLNTSSRCCSDFKTLLKKAGRSYFYFIMKMNTCDTEMCQLSVPACKKVIQPVRRGITGLNLRLTIISSWLRQKRLRYLTDLQ